MLPKSVLCTNYSGYNNSWPNEFWNDCMAYVGKSSRCYTIYHKTTPFRGLLLTQGVTKSQENGRGEDEPAEHSQDRTGQKD